jgi:hypothetical protein
LQNPAATHLETNVNALLIHGLFSISVLASPADAPTAPAAAPQLTLSQEPRPAHVNWGFTLSGLAGYPDGVGTRLTYSWKVLTLEGSVGSFLIGETASAHLGLRGLLYDGRDAGNVGWTWSGAALAGVHYLHQDDFFHDVGWTVWGPEVAARLECTRWMGAGGLTGALQVGGNHLYGREYFSQWAVLPTASLELGVAF